MITTAKLQWLMGLAISLIIGAIAFYIQSLKGDILSLKNDISELQKAKLVVELNHSTCKSSLVEQNKIRIEVANELLVKQNELVKWKNRKPEVKYKKIYEKIYLRDKNATCDDVVSSAATIDLNSL
ncbi:hemolysin [Thiohalocapsa phage LS06-2018-MD03]|nr:hemolysin [Thiohalocapsa phage LS06-2018-MD03]